MSIRLWRLATGRPRSDSRRARPRHRSRGQSLVELALILPILLLVLAAALDLGRLFYSRITVANAAREGAIEASLDPTSFTANAACNATTNRVMCRVVNETRSSFVTVAPADVAVSCNPVGCASGIGSSVTVKVTGHFRLITPLLAAFFTGGQNVSFSTSATAQINTAPVLTAGATPTPAATPTPTPTPAPGATPTPTPAPTAVPTATPIPVCVQPVANFSWTNPSNKKINFTDTSTNMSNPACANVWSWNFGDGSGSSSAQNPSYTYGNGSSKSVTLTVSNSAGSSAITKTVNP